MAASASVVKPNSQGLKKPFVKPNSQDSKPKKSEKWSDAPVKEGNKISDASIRKPFVKNGKRGENTSTTSGGRTFKKVQREGASTGAKRGNNGKNPNLKKEKSELSAEVVLKIKEMTDPSLSDLMSLVKGCKVNVPLMMALGVPEVVANLALHAAIWSARMESSRPATCKCGHPLKTWKNRETSVTGCWNPDCSQFIPTQAPLDTKAKVEVSSEDQEEDSEGEEESGSVEEEAGSDASEGEVEVVD